MKKFLIFLVSTIIIVCLGVTFYQFAKNDEVFSVTSETLYINYGETLSLDDIDFSRKEESQDTNIDFNAGGDEVTSIIKFDDVNKCYVPTGKGGATTIIISTSNKKYKRLAIDVVVGVGSEDNPYYISNESQLFNIGNAFELDGYYSLVKDIKLTKSHSPIGHTSTDDYAFTGKFNGNLHTISNLTITDTDGKDNAGLFAIIGNSGSVTNLNLENVSITGNYETAGAVAGINYGTLNRITVANPSINVSKSYACGGLVGVSTASNDISITPTIKRCYVYTDNNSAIKSTDGVAGGLIGTANSTTIQACHTATIVESASFVGGLVGQFELDNSDAHIYECYSISIVRGNSGFVGNLIGYIDLAGTASVEKSIALLGNYYNAGLNSFGGIGIDADSIATSNAYAVNGKSQKELKRKDTYIYYIDSTGNEKYWDSMWYLEDGQYPVLSGGNQVAGDINASSPSGDGDEDNPEIIVPTNPNTEGKILSTKSDVVKYLQTDDITGTYILSNNIDMGGMVWTPVKFSGTLKSTNGNQYSISNFKIKSTAKNVGFFSVIKNASISSIGFENVTISSGSSCAGILAGIIQGNTTISDVCITNCSISNSSDYAGLIVGYTSSSDIKIENCRTLSSGISGNNSNAGGLVAYVGANTSITNCTIDVAVIKAVNKLGGFVAINYGKISNLSFDGRLSSVGSSTQGYFGGGVGVNIGTTKDCHVSIDTMTVENTAPSGESVSYIVGGFVGYNKGGIVKTCDTFVNKILTGTSKSRVYIGGICGYNSGELTESFCSSSQIGTANSTDCVAGIVAYNYGGKVSGCFTHTDKMAGLIVSGIAMSNSNNGSIDSCFVGQDMLNRTLLTGKNISGIVYDIISGEISNCLISAELRGTNSDGFISGFATFMPYTTDKFGTISKCVADVSFTGSGYKYLLTTQEGILDKKQCTGAIINCVINKEASTKETIIPTPSTLTFIIWNIKTYTPGSKTNYTVASTAELYTITLYLGSKLNFDISSGSNDDSKWIYFNQTRLPLPRQIFKATVNIAG